jgi:hypothetical protein
LRPADGQVLADWLVNVGGSTTPGQIPLRGANHSIAAVGTARRWIHAPSFGAVQYVDALTPIGGAACGRIVLSDVHIATGGASAVEDKSAPDLPFPSGCVTTDLSPQEKALEHMFFAPPCTQP